MSIPEHIAKRGLTPDEARELFECHCGQHYYDWALRMWLLIGQKGRTVVIKTITCTDGRGPDHPSCKVPQ